jgi:DNA invertase Pin-like site-specific DNA recombinase
LKIVAYLYSNPLLEPTPDPTLWGWEIDQVYQDLGTGKQRAQLQQLLKDAQMGSIGYVLVRRLEELGNSTQMVSNRLVTLQQLQVQVVPVEQSLNVASLQAESVSTPPLSDQDLRLELLLFLQAMQHQYRSRQIREGHARNRLKSLPPPGKAPYGYRRGKDRYVLDRLAAPIVKDFFEHFLLYGSVRGAVRYLEKNYGKKISASTGHRWLLNPVYQGDLLYQNGEQILDTHIPIISREEAAQVDRLLRRNRRLPPRTASAPRSLAGLAVCAACQSPMTVVRVTAPRRPKAYLYLHPTQCPLTPGCPSLPYADVLEQTIQGICQDLPVAVSGVNLPNLDSVTQRLQDQIQQKQAVLTQLPSLLQANILDQETLDLRTYTLKAEMAALQIKLTQLPPVNLQQLAQAVSIPQFWQDLSETERRFYFREFIRQIQIVRQDGAWHCKLNFIFEPPPPLASDPVDR